MWGVCTDIKQHLNNAISANHTIIIIIIIIIRIRIIIRITNF